MSKTTATKQTRKRLTKEEKALQVVEEAKEAFKPAERIKMIDISIDKLSLVGELNNTLKNTMKKEKLESTLSFDPYWVFNGYKDGDATFIYREKFYVAIGGQNSMKLKQKMRVEFNPNKVSEEDMEYLEDVIETFTSQVKFTRIDIAFDVRNVLSEYKFFMKKYKKKETFIRGVDGHLETIYLGTTNSEIMYRVYDKKVEQGLDEKEPDWWRFEVVYRREKANEFQLFNPFWNLIISQPNIDRINTFRLRSDVARLIQEPKEWQHIDKNQVSFYKKVIELASSETDLAPAFARQFEKKKADLVAQVSRFKKLCGNDEQITLTTLGKEWVNSVQPIEMLPIFNYFRRYKNGLDLPKLNHFRKIEKAFTISKVNYIISQRATKLN